MEGLSILPWQLIDCAAPDGFCAVLNWRSIRQALITAPMISDSTGISKHPPSSQSQSSYLGRRNCHWGICRVDSINISPIGFVASIIPSLSQSRKLIPQSPNHESHTTLGRWLDSVLARYVWIRLQELAEWSHRISKPCSLHVCRDVPSNERFLLACMLSGLTSGVSLCDGASCQRMVCRKLRIASAGTLGLPSRDVDSSISSACWSEPATPGPRRGISEVGISDSGFRDMLSGNKVLCGWASESKRGSPIVPLRCITYGIS